jgi:hypothetical protein
VTGVDALAQVGVPSVFPSDLAAHSPPRATGLSHTWVADHRNAPVNALGYLRIMFAVEDIDDALARLRRTEPSWLVNWRSTRISIGSVTSEALRGSSSGWPSRSASGLSFRDWRAPQASFPNVGPVEVTASMSGAGLRCDRDDQTSGKLG